MKWRPTITKMRPNLEGGFIPDCYAATVYRGLASEIDNGVQG